MVIIPYDTGELRYCFAKLILDNYGNIIGTNTADDKMHFVNWKEVLNRC